MWPKTFLAVVAAYVRHQKIFIKCTKSNLIHFKTFLLLGYTESIWIKITELLELKRISLWFNPLIVSGETDAQTVTHPSTPENTSRMRTKT